MNTNFEIIGEGFKGCVVKFNGVDLLSKIGYKYNLETEYTNIKMLPKKDYFYNTDTVFMADTNTLDEKIFKNKCTKYNKNIISDLKLAKLLIPIVEGESLLMVCDKYTDQSIKKSEWFNIIYLYCKLFYEIVKFNKEYNLYHNDLSLGNIIYNEFEQKLTVIDFGTLDTKPTKIYNDQEKMIFGMISLLDIGIKNEKIKKWLLQNNIIDSNLNLIEKDNKIISSISEKINNMLNV